MKIETVPPPDALLVPCEKPEPGEMRTNGDLARYASALKYALDACAARVDAIKIFFTIDASDWGFNQSPY